MIAGRLPSLLTAAFLLAPAFAVPSAADEIKILNANGDRCPMQRAGPMKFRSLAFKSFGTFADRYARISRQWPRSACHLWSQRSRQIDGPRGPRLFSLRLFAPRHPCLSLRAWRPADCGDNRRSRRQDPGGRSPPRNEEYVARRRRQNAARGRCRCGLAWPVSTEISSRCCSASITPGSSPAATKWRRDKAASVRRCSRPAPVSPGLRRIDKHLEARLADLFKRAGKNQAIALGLNQLKSERQELKYKTIAIEVWLEKKDQLESAVARQKELEAEHATLQRERYVWRVIAPRCPRCNRLVDSKNNGANWATFPFCSRILANSIERPSKNKMPRPNRAAPVRRWKKPRSP